MDHISKHQAEMRARIYGCYNNQTQQATEEELEKSANDYFEKSRSKSTIGEIKSFGGRNYIKTASGWKYHGKGTSAKAQEHAKGALTHHVENEHEQRAAKLSDEELDQHYGVEMPSPGESRRSEYFKALHKELLKREKDPKSKFYVGEDKEQQKEKKPLHSDNDVAIHENAKEIAEHHGLSLEEYKQLHPGTKKELLTKMKVAQHQDKMKKNK